MAVKAIAALPGGGKSRLIADLQNQGYSARDDMNRNWLENISQVLEWLAQGKNVVVSDIEFVKQEWRDRLERDLAGIHIQWEFFANDPHKCIRNVVFRVYVEQKARPLREEAGKIRDYTKLYNPPKNARPVVLADSTPEGLAKFYGSPEAALEWARGLVSGLEAMLGS
jgi:hypothetical protein